MSIRFFQVPACSQDRRFCFKAILGALALALQIGAVPTTAMAGAEAYFVRDRYPTSEELVRGAFATPFGRTVVAEFEAILAESRDAACERSSDEKAGKLSERAEAILVENGTRIYDYINRSLERAVISTALTSVGGSVEELERLEADPEVRTFVDLAQPYIFELVVKEIISQIDTSSLYIGGFNLVRPLGNNQTILRAEPRKMTSGELAAEKKSPNVRRFLELADRVSLNYTREYFDSETEVRDNIVREMESLCLRKLRK